MIRSQPRTFTCTLIAGLALAAMALVSTGFDAEQVPQPPAARFNQLSVQAVSAAAQADSRARLTTSQGEAVRRNAGESALIDSSRATTTPSPRHSAKAANAFNVRS